ncbi:uncharacterized protein LY89DRAFT_576039 [Mollisia scopiformis]|uniref:Uncharacterized protein n=1 Tax=Mollisia scopiformis TaxID=149040 RepID=A0A194XPI1_MOLSC|nr:uncharacterized protein LY89DRAFT_576039 [Mollisia scopiformis]KUJ22098.1 hypothetical protein LY89DRAFT_576039 [Mollisia scopiformis]
MHTLTHTILSLLLFCLTTTNACMHYKATFPFNPTLPFEASISDNRITTCWISTTYAEHRALQIAVKAQKSEEAGFLPWEFECLRLGIEGYKAHANVGARTVTYIAHGQEFYFIPKEKEDVVGEKWVYDLKLWCGKPGKGGLIAP